MSLFASSLIAKILTPFLIVSGWFHTVAPQNFGASLPQGVAVFETALLSAITSSASSMTLTANSVRGGSTLSGFNCFTIDEGKAEREDVCGTVSGTTVSSLTRGVDPLTATTTNATLQFAHRRGAQVKVTDFPIIQIMRHQLNGSDTLASPMFYASGLSFSSSTNQIPSALWVAGFANVASTSAFNQILGGANTFTGLQTFNTLPQSSAVPGTGNDLVNKTYVDGVAIAGASNADTTTKGIVEEATVAEINAGTATGGTGARLYVNPAQMLVSNFASTTYGATSSVPMGVSDAAYRVATTTFMRSNQALMIWAKCEVNDNGRTVLYVKPTNAGTSTIDSADDANDAVVGYEGFMGMFASSTDDQNVEIYLGGTGAKNYKDTCVRGGIQFIKFNK